MNKCYRPTYTQMYHKVHGIGGVTQLECKHSCSTCKFNTWCNRMENTKRSPTYLILGTTKKQGLTTFDCYKNGPEPKHEEGQIIIEVDQHPNNKYSMKVLTPDMLDKEEPVREVEKITEVIKEIEKIVEVDHTDEVQSEQLEKLCELNKLLSDLIEIQKRPRAIYNA